MDPAAHSLTLSLIGGGFVAAALHTALPTHWLPFVLVGRAQGWTGRQTLWAAAAAAFAHTLSTATVGLLIIAAGLAIDHWITGLLPYLAGGALLGMGGWYLWRYSRRPARGVGAQAVAAERTTGHGHAAAFWGLIVMLAVSPGEVLLPLYLGAANAGVPALLALTVAFWAGATLGMVVLTGFAWAGSTALKLERLARYEGLILGLALIGLGLIVLFHPH
ncbi:hypothetical protein [Brevundimonas sp.]|uniref:hypothetical protein n=1 Tax=Brevundimonas sp. TaxID=1871086 RepID=UPI0035B1BB99